jgi:hypothetical protein
MRNLIFLMAVLTLLAAAVPAMAITTPSSGSVKNPPVSLVKKISTYKEKDLRKQLGRKLTLKEKVAFFFLKKKAKKMAAEEGKTGENSFVAGLIAIGLLVTGLFFAPLLIGSLVAAIVAITSGSKSLKLEPGNKKARTGRLLGWITIVSLVGIAIAILVFIAIFAGALGSLFG